MRDFIVYTSSPINGLTFSEATGWRTYVASQLSPFNIRCASPLRDQEYRSYTGVLGSTTKEAGLLTASRAIMTRDYFDCVRADMVLVNLLGAKRVSIGTCMELAWAYQARIPVVLVMEPSNIHNHPMITESVGWMVTTLDEGVHLVKHVLLPEGAGCLVTQADHESESCS